MKLREYSICIPERFLYHGCARSLKIWCCCGGSCRASRKGCPAPYDLCFLPIVTTHITGMSTLEVLRSTKNWKKWAKNATNHGLKPGIPVNIFPYPIWSKCQTSLMIWENFPSFPHQLQLQRTISWTIPTQRVGLHLIVELTALLGTSQQLAHRVAILAMPRLKDGRNPNCWWKKSGSINLIC